MKIETVPLSSIRPDSANARKHNARNLDAIKASLKRFGQQKPIVVDRQGRIRCGNGTFEAAETLGWETIAIVRSELPDQELMAFALADNRTAELAEWDIAILQEQMDSLQEGGFDVAQLEISDDDLAKMITDLDVETEAAQAPPVEIEVADVFKVVITCKDETQQVQLIKRFAKQGLRCRGTIG